jgi:hypothetical protein
MACTLNSYLQIIERRSSTFDTGSAPMLASFVMISLLLLSRSLLLLLQGQAAAHSALLGLPIALHHTALNTDYTVLCRAAQVCKCWRAAVQQCAARDLKVELNTSASPAHLRGFPDWLSKHACFVSSITAAVPDWKAEYAGNIQPVDAERWQGHFLDVEVLLLQALLLAAAPADTAVLNPAAAAAAAAVLPEQQGLQLSSFATGLPGAALLAALPAHSLTKLELAYADNTAVDGPALSAALARLSNLRQLSIISDMHDNLPGSCLEGVMQLSCLTSLKLAGDWSDLDVYLQPVLHTLKLRQLQQLDLIGLKVAVDGGLVLSHLTQLTELSIEDLDPYHDGEFPVKLPSQLQRLQLGACEGPVSFAYIMQLKQLKHLSLVVEGADNDQLLQLGQLPGLEHLALLYHEPDVAAATAPVWQRLKQLQELQLDLDDEGSSSQELGVVLAGVAACRGITKLMMKFSLADNNSSSSSEAEGEEPSNGEAGEAAEEGAERGEAVQRQGTDGSSSSSGNSSRHDNANGDGGGGDDARAAGGDDARAEDGAVGGDGSAQQPSLDVFATAAGLSGLQDLCISSYTESVVPGDALALTALTGLTRLVLEGCGAAVGDLEATAIATSCRGLHHLDLRRCELGRKGCLALVAQLPRLQVWQQEAVAGCLCVHECC